MDRIRDRQTGQGTDRWERGQMDSKGGQTTRRRDTREEGQRWLTGGLHRGCSGAGGSSRLGSSRTSGRGARVGLVAACWAGNDRRGATS